MDKLWQDFTALEQMQMKSTLANGGKVEYLTITSGWKPVPSEESQFYNNIKYRYAESDAITDTERFEFFFNGPREKSTAFQHAYVVLCNNPQTTLDDWRKLIDDAIREERKLIPDTFDWSALCEDRWKYAARGPDGGAYIFTELPTMTGERWASGSGTYRLVNHLAAYKVGTVDWKDSLIKRYDD